MIRLPGVDAGSWEAHARRRFARNFTASVAGGRIRVRTIGVGIGAEMEPRPAHAVERHAAQGCIGTPLQRIFTASFRFYVVK
jgi:hypothetical protein